MSVEMDVRLLPCPFCGNEALVKHRSATSRDGVKLDLVKIYCDAAECDVRPETMGWRLSDVALRSWNRRKECEILKELYMNGHNAHYKVQKAAELIMEITEVKEAVDR